jgi:hypothetical protein
MNKEMARPAPDPRAPGFRLSWISNALMWSSAARRLLHADQPAEAQLAFVALHLCVKLASQLVDGTALVPAEITARIDCPVDPRELRRIRDRLAGFRDEILHLPDKVDDGREISMSWSADPPHFTLKSTVGRYTIGRDSMAREDAERLLDQLDPWLRRHYERLLRQRVDP